MSSLWPLKDWIKLLTTDIHLFDRRAKWVPGHGQYVNLNMLQDYKPECKTCHLAAVSSARTESALPWPICLSQHRNENFLLILSNGKGK